VDFARSALECDASSHRFPSVVVAYYVQLINVHLLLLSAYIRVIRGQIFSSFVYIRVHSWLGRVLT